MARQAAPADDESRLRQQMKEMENGAVEEEGAEVRGELLGPRFALDVEVLKLL